jgi:N-acetylmuramoyl-L-alanine amidase
MEVTRRDFTRALILGAIGLSLDEVVQATEVQKVIFFSGHTRKIGRQGAVSSTKIPEAEYNDQVLRRVEGIWKGAAEFVYSKQNVSLVNRPSYAKRHNGALYVELHHDTGFKIDVVKKRWDLLRGFSVYFCETNPFGSDSRLAGENVGQELCNNGFDPCTYYTLPGKTKGRKAVNPTIALYSANDLFVLRNGMIPSVLVECGNIINPNEEILARDPKNQEKVAQSIVSGITAYLSK